MAQQGQGNPSIRDGQRRMDEEALTGCAPQRPPSLCGSSARPVSFGRLWYDQYQGHSQGGLLTYHLHNIKVITRSPYTRCVVALNSLPPVEVRTDVVGPQRLRERFWWRAFHVA